MATLTAQQVLAQSKTLVIKVGSSLLIDAHGNLNEAWLEQLAQEITLLHQSKRILIVSSGAIALGRQALGLQNDKLKLEESQAAAAAGQIHLATAWHKALSNMRVAQVLLTSGDTEERRRYLNARSTLMTLLELGAIPVINENDTIATDEIRYGDNDRLAARVANIVGADCLVLLSTVDGLLSQDPLKESGAPLIEVIDKITPEIEAIAGDRGSALNRGGMKAKLVAAKIARQGGCAMIIAQGRRENPLKALLAGSPCSLFPSSTTPQAARKIWIGGSLKPQGELIIDDGAALALKNGKSLLPAGIKALKGDFTRGEPVSIKSESGRELARGLCAYAIKDAQKIIGHKSDEIEAILGYRGRQAMVHRDDLVLLSEVNNG